MEFLQSQLQSTSTQRQQKAHMCVQWRGVVVGRGGRGPGATVIAILK